MLPSWTYMKKTFLFSGLSWCSIFGFLGVTMQPLGAQTTLYFDQNGATPGFGLNRDTVYDWSTVGSVWNTNSTGGAGTLSSWNNAANNIAFFDLLTGEYGATPNSLPLQVRLTGATTIGGLSLRQRGNWGNLILQADSGAPQNITFSPGATVSADAVSAFRGVVFGENVNLVGNFKITGSGQGSVQIVGSGNAYNGTITIETVNSISSGFLYNTAPTSYEGVSRVASTAKFVINSGSLITNGGGSGVVIGELSGSGGYIRPSGETVFTINQTTNTEWAGQIGSEGLNFITFIKAGEGRLSLNGTSGHNIVRAMRVDGGKLYIRSAITGSGTNFTVASGAALGGTTTTGKVVILAAATSILDPGMHGEAGTLTLQGGLTGSSGGEFHFGLNGLQGSDTLFNSSIVMTGGTLTLAGNKVARFFDLGGGLIESGVAYTLLDASSESVVRTAGWNLNWSYDLGQTGWEVQSFGVNGNRLQVTFNVVPEPSSLVLVSIAIFWILMCRRRQRMTDQKCC